MTALLAIVLGFTAVGYAAWPWLVRGGTVRPLTATDTNFDPSLDSQLVALRGWSIAVGELPADPAHTGLKASE